MVIWTTAMPRRKDPGKEDKATKQPTDISRYFPRRVTREKTDEGIQQTTATPEILRQKTTVEREHWRKQCLTTMADQKPFIPSERTLSILQRLAEELRIIREERKQEREQQKQFEQQFEQQREQQKQFEQQFKQQLEQQQKTMTDIITSFERSLSLFYSTADSNGGEKQNKTNNQTTTSKTTTDTAKIRPMERLIVRNTRFPDPKYCDFSQSAGKLTLRLSTSAAKATKSRDARMITMVPTGLATPAQAWPKISRESYTIPTSHPRKILQPQS